MTINTCQQLESALIGSLLVAPEKIIKIADKIKPTDFTDSRAMSAYVAIMAEYQKKKAINMVSISAQLPDMGMYFATITSDAYPPGIVRFAEDIAKRAKSRRLTAGLEALAKSATTEEMLSGMLDLYNHEMTAGNKSPDIKSVLSRVSELIDKNRSSGKVGFSTGFDVHENIYYRYLPGHIWTIGGFTSVGKTAVMIQKICNMLSGGEDPSIIVISTEMTEEQVVARIISNFTGIHSMRILSGNYHSAEEENSVSGVKKSLSKSRLQIYDDIYQLEDIETAFRRADLQGGVDVGFIDYVQNCRWSGSKSEYQEQSTMAKRFQSLAKDVSATIICLSQVSNDVGRGNIDQLELKGAGEWAAVSDFGVMLKRHKTEKHRLKYQILKNRHGALGECGLDFVNVYTSLQEIL